MKLSIIGTHGIPANYGGFETFAEVISRLLVKNGFEVSVQCDRNDKPLKSWGGAKLYYSPYLKSRNPIKYYFDGVKWGLRTSDILLVTGTGGSVFYFLNYFKKKIILTNPDGLEHKRPKWSLPVRLYLKFTESLAVRFSDFIIADSRLIEEYLISAYKSVSGKIRVIEYGAYVNDSHNNKILEKYSLKHKNYFLVVCRLEPENNLHTVLKAYIKSASESPLVIVGNLIENNYVKKLQSRYESDKIIFPGGIYDKDELNTLRYSCKAYIHGHSVGGTNPSLLEAMGSRNLILCHDNVYNREVTGNTQLYFNDVEECRINIDKINLFSENDKERFGEIALERICNYYNWDNILEKYLKMFSEIKGGNNGSDYSFSC